IRAAPEERYAPIRRDGTEIVRAKCIAVECSRRIFAPIARCQGGAADAQSSCSVWKRHASLGIDHVDYGSRYHKTSFAPLEVQLVRPAPRDHPRIECAVGVENLA